ncbi:MAG TPA: alpha/beta fold hydrolase [Armatimonadota bacterium]|jgi:pimeloyl-ACP methyl ester carboxylesterase
MMETPVLIPHAGEQLVADLALGSAEAVIVLPGWGGTRYGPQRILLRTAAACAARGYTTLRLDFRGRGDSGGSATASSLDGMIADVTAAVEWLCAEHQVTRVHLVGLCSGGNVALGAASLLPQVQQVVCWSLLPFMEHKGLAAQQGTHRGQRLQQLLRKALRPETWRKLLRGEANVRGAMHTVVQDKEGDANERQRKTSRRDILAQLQHFSGRLHLLYGGQDPEAAGSEAFFSAWCQQHHIPVDTRVIAGAPHNFYTAQWTEAVVTQTVQWLTEA